MAHHLYKNKKDGMIFGVCAGLADWTGLDTSLLRILMVLVSYEFKCNILDVFTAGYLLHGKTRIRLDKTDSCAIMK